MVRRKRLIRRRRFFTILWLAVFFLLGGALALANQLGLLPRLLPGLIGDPGGNVVEAGQPPDSFTVLLLGTDARPGEKVGRTDSIIVANVDGEKKRIALLSIPRDTRVDIPGHGTDKINAAAVYGGPALTAETVSELIGMPVQYYALARWEGFKDIVDALGGVTIDVERNMYHYDSTDGKEYAINLPKGVQRLDGSKALQYVRFRSDALGDIGRTERQLKFLKALAQEIMQPATIVKLPRLVPEINKSMETNMGPRQMLALARAARYFEQAEIVTQTMPGHFLDMNGVSYWAVDPDKAHEVALSLFEEGRVTEVVQGPSVNKEAYSSGQVAIRRPVTGPQPPPKKAVLPPLPGGQGTSRAPAADGSAGTAPDSAPGQDGAALDGGEGSTPDRAPGGGGTAQSGATGTPSASNKQPSGSSGQESGSFDIRIIPLPTPGSSG